MQSLTHFDNQHQSDFNHVSYDPDLYWLVRESVILSPPSLSPTTSDRQTSGSPQIMSPPTPPHLMPPQSNNQNCNHTFEALSPESMHINSYSGHPDLFQTEHGYPYSDFNETQSWTFPFTNRSIYETSMPDPARFIVPTALYDYSMTSDQYYCDHPQTRGHPEPISTKAIWTADSGYSPHSTCQIPSPDSVKPEFHEEEHEPHFDKPYARLIFEALSQAHNHRMMLREIYDWFEKYTTKPKESGSNGWQNSIRHNLSMNKAFENEKNDANGKGEVRKSNSVWILTEDALRNGVQSTTRYRKTGGAKRTTLKGKPAVQRQESGARGGHAARRAARLRRRERPSDHVSVTMAGSTLSDSFDWLPAPTSTDDYFGGSHSSPPATSEPQRFRNVSFTPEGDQWTGSDTLIKPEGNGFLDHESRPLAFIPHGSEDSTYDNIMRLERHSTFPTVMC